VIDRVRDSLGGFGGGKYRRIGVAVSGGADSIFLLTAVKELGLAAAILHVNHQLRGLESDADEAFVRSLADRLGLHCEVATLPPGEGNVEQEARNLRYGFFAECVAKGICDTVATGHTLDDQAETVLFRLLRGSASAGLSGIRPEIIPGIIRPMLRIRRSEIRDYLQSHSLPWREDTSNSDLRFQRNRLRLNIMPELEKINPSLPEVLASTAEWARAEEDYWKRELDVLEPLYLRKPRGKTVLLDIEPFTELPLAVQRRLLRRAVQSVRGDLRSIGFGHIEAVRKMMATREGSGRVQLPELDVYRSFDQLRLAPQQFDAQLERNFSVSIRVPGEVELPERALALRLELIAHSRVYNSEVNVVDPAKCPGSLLLRNWRPGDQFEWAGSPGAIVKIKTLFQSYRIPLWERRGWPVLVVPNETGGAERIVWTRRFGVAREFAAAKGCETVCFVNELVADLAHPGIESARAGV